MGRTKWKNRTPDDKGRILEQQQKQLEDSNEPRMGRTFEDRTEEATEIMRNHEIPIRCPKCLRWSGSDKYEIEKDAILPGLPKQDMIKGKCRHCGCGTRRLMMTSMDDMMITGMLIIHLSGEGRVVDRRKER